MFTHSHDVRILYYWKAAAWRLGFGFSRMRARPKPLWSRQHGPAWLASGLFGPGLARLTASGRALHSPSTDSDFCSPTKQLASLIAFHGDIRLSEQGVLDLGGQISGGLLTFFSSSSQAGDYLSHSRSRPWPPSWDKTSLLQFPSSILNLIIQYSLMSSESDGYQMDISRYLSICNDHWQQKRRFNILLTISLRYTKII